MTAINNKEVYQKRMCQSTDYKFDAVKDYLYSSAEFLDFGSGFNPKFIKKIENTGAIYTAYDEDKNITHRLATEDINVVGIAELISKKQKYDVIFMSSVLHEILSFKSVPMVIHTLENIYQALKPGGHLIIRDWDNPDADKYKCIESYQEIIKTDKIPEVTKWANALYENAITETDIDISHTPLFIHNELYRKTGTIYACGADLFELMFHVIWGEDSLARESEEKYDTSCAIEKYLLRQHNDLNLVERKEEYDESFLPHLQKYFNIEELPYPTKLVSVYQKSLTR